MPREDYLGVFIIAVASLISTAGVIANNYLLDHVLAMLIWRWSNFAFILYFFGRWRGWWNGGVSDLVMVGFYALCAATNEIGLS